jgi:hypothetical protein
MERLYSSALGSSPRSTALDAEVEHSMDCDENQALAVRKVSRTQKFACRTSRAPCQRLAAAAQRTDASQEA